MLTPQQKNDILQLVEEEKHRLGSYRAVATKCRISETSISLLRKGQYAAEGDDIYTTIALALGFAFDTVNWNIADTANFREVTLTLDIARKKAMFVPIAHKAGSGKTAACKVYLANNRRSGGVFMLTCREWNGRSFLLELVREIGAELPKGYANINTLIDCISNTFKRMAHLRPLLIIDQANSLKIAALRTLIHLYNDLEDLLAVVALGTENLEYEIKRGVRLTKFGYDEISSRFGTKFIHLTGANLADTRKICDANGVTDKESQSRIFHACEPSKVTLEDGRSTYVIEDIRRLKRLIKREHIQLEFA